MAPVNVSLEGLFPCRMMSPGGSAPVPATHPAKRALWGAEVRARQLPPPSGRSWGAGRSARSFAFLLARRTALPSWAQVEDGQLLIPEGRLQKTLRLERGPRPGWRRRHRRGLANGSFLDEVTQPRRPSRPSRAHHRATPRSSEPRWGSSPSRSPRKAPQERGAKEP